MQYRSLGWLTAAGCGRYLRQVVAEEAKAPALPSVVILPRKPIWKRDRVY